MKRILTALYAVMVTAPAFAAEELEARIERLERQAYLGSAAFFLAGYENCGLDLPQDQVQAVFTDGFQDGMTTIGIMLSHGAIGRLYSMGQRNEPDGDYCRTLRSSLPEFGISPNTN